MEYKESLIQINIVFFGASVTKQKNGYVWHFSNLCKSHNNNFVINQYGYGGMHIKDAGVCFIENVLKNHPQYCFLDWFSTGYIPNNTNLKDYLDNFRYQFLSNNCQIIFLLLDRKNVDDRIGMYNQIIEYANIYSIPYINTCNLLSDKDKLLRDLVHTTDVGSELYAQKIYHYFMQNILNKYTLNLSNLVVNKFANIKKLFLSDKIIQEFIKIKGSAEIIGVNQIVGPHSGILNVDVDGSLSKINLFDCWCYYKRNVLKIEKKFNHYLNIFVSQEGFDRTVAKEQIDWPTKMVIQPLDYLYYIGDITDIEIF